MIVLNITDLIKIKTVHSKRKLLDRKKTILIYTDPKSYSILFSILYCSGKIDKKEKSEIYTFLKD